MLGSGCKMHRLFASYAGKDGASRPRPDGRTYDNHHCRCADTYNILLPRNNIFAHCIKLFAGRLPPKHLLLKRQTDFKVGRFSRGTLPLKYNNKQRYPPRRLMPSRRVFAFYGGFNPVLYIYVKFKYRLLKQLTEKPFIKGRKTALKRPQSKIRRSFCPRCRRRKAPFAKSPVRPAKILPFPAPAPFPPALRRFAQAQF